MSDDLSHIRDIRDGCEYLFRTTRGLTAEQLLANEDKYGAVQHRLLIIGEAVKRLSEAFRNKHPQIPWRGFAGMGDRIIHRYEEVDIMIVWETIRTDIPTLLAVVESALPPNAEPA